MTRMLTAIAVLALVATFSAPVSADTPKAEAVMMPPKTASVGAAAPNFTLTDISGQQHSLSDFKGKYVVLEWINFGCPFVKKHYESGNMQRLQKQYLDKDVVWLTICSSAPGKQGHYSGSELLQVVKEHRVSGTAYLVDADGRVGQMYQAKTTPNMYVINPAGVLIYAGAIDDNPSPKPEVIPTSLNYVAQALELAMAGQPVKNTVTQPYGCSVKYDVK